MTKITCWYAINDKNQRLFNHIEDGWKGGKYPLPKKPEFTNQKSWSKMRWEKRFTYLKDGKVLEYDCVV